MSAFCVPSSGGLHRFFRLFANSIVAFGLVLTLAAVDVGGHGVQAQAPAAEPPRTEAPAWCLQRSEKDPPHCIYDSFPSCVIAGFKEGGYCISNPGPTAAAAATPADQAQRRRTARAAPAQPNAAPSSQQNAAAGAQASQTAQAQRRRKLTAAEREKIFNDFQNWRAQRGDDKAH